QVQSRVKALEKLERIEVDIEDKAAMTVKFPPAPRSGDIVFKAVDLVAGYPSPKPGDKPKVVFSDAQIEVMRGEKVALVGRNGEGKTTLMRILMRELDPLDGEAKTGYNVNIGYYAQNQEDVLDKQDTVFGTLDRIAVGDIRTKLRDILAAFLFKGEDIDKKVAVLSGGERARLAMAKLMLTPYNLLALDEPTNHMDILSKDILKQALQRYDGTLIIVSHDRDFLEGLVDKVYEFRDGRVKEHLGGIDEFLRSRKIESLSELERKSAVQQTQGSKTEAQGSVKSQGGSYSDRPADAPAPQKSSASERQERKFLSKEQRKLKNRVDFLEKSIAQLEAAQKEIETRLQAPGPDDDIIELTRKYLENKREIDNQTEEWLELSQQL
ncbi:MAG: ATP-binding cassette domain-containing protein, partial [Bacteroidales bacterium]|nr:ATP-binding cassette domain-containing protein [Bacteroidales bacterium]